MNQDTNAGHARLAFVLTLCALVIAVPSTGFAATGGFSAFQPEGTKTANLNIGGRVVPYSLLTTTGEIALALEGPAELRILSRLGFSPGAGGTQKYTLEITEGGKIFTSNAFQTQVSGSVFDAPKVAAGKSRKWTVTIPRGTHAFKLRLKDASQSEVFLRFLLNGKNAAVNSVSVAPLAFSKVVTAMIGEKPVPYYVATSRSEVTLRVMGPLQLRISSRLSFDARMAGAQRYAVVVQENGKHVVTEPLSTTRSAGVEYSDWKEVAPGENQAFFMHVPAGEHMYSFFLAPGVAPSVALRFFIPKDKM